MGLQLLCLVLSTASMAVLGKDEGADVRRWSRQRLPLLLDARTECLDASSFTGREEDEVEGGGKKEAICGIECQTRLPLIGQREQERILGYETMYENGTRTHTDVTLQGFNVTGVAARSRSHARRKRQVYGADGRFVITDTQYITNYPFSAAVRLSTGCSGVLVSPRHVLTAAHCVHDGRDYLEGARTLRVGALQLKAKRRGRGRGKGGRKRSGRRRGGEAEEGDEHNSIDGELEKVRRGGGGADGIPGGEGGRRKQGRGGRAGRAGRARRSAEPGKAPVFRWTRVKQTRVPQGWIRPGGPPNPGVAPDYDYAILELKRPMKQKHMEVGVAPPNAPLARIHFSGYDSDKSLLDGRGDGKVVYRFCSVAKESDDLIYQHCDAQPGATGAGVYVRLKQDAGGKGRWQRRVIGVYSGHQWVETDDGQQRDFNVAVRITPAKYAQICHWIHGDPALCKEV